MRVALLLALAALCTAVATGCAADSSAPAKANLRAPVEPPAASPFVTIDSPGDRAVTARQDVLGIRAMADVAGRGNAGDLVQVSTGCDDPRCAAGTQVDAAGHWTVRVLLKATKTYPRVRVVAQSGAQVAISLARLGLPEAKTASRINHSNVLNVIDFGSASDGVVYAVYEGENGETLQEIIKNSGKLDAAAATDIAGQAADGLAAIHSHGMVHGNLTPENILIANDGSDRPHVKLFGVGSAGYGR